jgi:peptidoglycan hydrolase-like protein with peptidoglycan-binding domain/GNAT superfamily N-acetyltransferase
MRPTDTVQVELDGETFDIGIGALVSQVPELLAGASFDREARGWDEASHPRAPKGSASGGQFMAYDKSKNQGTGYGKKGGDASVRELQEALNKLGFTDANGRKLEVDGQLGPLTTTAIMKAQKQLGVKQDGKVDKALLEKILKMKGGHKPAAHEDHSKQPHKPTAHQDHKGGASKPHKPGTHQDVKGPGDGKFHSAPAHHKAGPASAHSGVDTGKPKAKPPAKKKPAKPEPPHYQHVSVKPGGQSGDRGGWWPSGWQRSGWDEASHPRDPGGKFAHVPGLDLVATKGKRKGISHNTITAKIWGEKAGHIRLTGEGTEIDDLAVSPKHRGKGVAHRLMQEAIDKFGHQTIRLHASPFGKGGLDAEGLMAFYAKHGFVPEPDRGKGYMVRHPSGGRSADADGEQRAKWNEGKHPRTPDGKFAHLSTAQLAHEIGKVNYQLGAPTNQIDVVQKALQAKHKALKHELNKRPDKPAKIPEWTPGTPPVNAPAKPAAPAAPVEAPKPVVHDLPKYEPKPPKRPAEPKSGVSNAEDMDLDRDQRRAIREYSGGRYRDINHTLRGKDWTYSDTQELIDGLDSVFEAGAKTDRPMSVKRRVMGARLFLGEPGSKVGKTFTDPAFVSTTEMADMKKIAGVFGHDEIDIHLPEGTPALRLGKLSNNSHEQEILLKRGTRFKVLSDEQTPEGRRVKLEVVL